MIEENLNKETYFNMGIRKNKLRNNSVAMKY